MGAVSGEDSCRVEAHLCFALEEQAMARWLKVVGVEDRATSAPKPPPPKKKPTQPHRSQPASQPPPPPQQAATGQPVTEEKAKPPTGPANDRDTQALWDFQPSREL